MKVGIVVSGLVGSACAVAIALDGKANELAQVDPDANLAKAHAEAILLAMPFSQPIRVNTVGYPMLLSASLVVLACGVGQKPAKAV